MKTLEVLRVYLNENQLKEKTHQAYVYTMTMLAEVYPEFPERSGDILSYIHGLKHSPESRRTFLKRISAVARHMERNYDLPNPCAKIKRGAVVVPKKERRIFTAIQMMQVVQACKTPYERMLIMLLIETGARISELNMLRYEDVKDDCVITSEMGKTGSHRYECSPDMVKVLRDLVSPGEYIFKNLTQRTDGRVPSLDTVKHIVRRLVKAAGITGNKLGAHTFRHSVASMFARETGSALSVMKKLQHGDIATSMKYIHEMENQKNSGLSPLTMVAKEVMERTPNSGVQLAITERASVEVKNEKDLVVLADSMEAFKIPEGLESIRPKLSRRDLEVIRLGFVSLMDAARFGSQVSDAQSLWKRFFRKAV